MTSDDDKQYPAGHDSGGAVSNESRKDNNSMTNHNGDGKVAMIDHPWMRSFLDRVEADPRVRAHIEAGAPFMLVVDTSDGRVGSRADLTCDRCGGYFADGLWPLYLPAFRDPTDYDRMAQMSGLDLMRRAVLMVSVGLCDECRDEVTR